MSSGVYVDAGDAALTLERIRREPFQTGNDLTYRHRSSLSGFDWHALTAGPPRIRARRPRRPDTFPPAPRLGHGHTPRTSAAAACAARWPRGRPPSRPSSLPPTGRAWRAEGVAPYGGRCAPGRPGGSRPAPRAVIQGRAVACAASSVGRSAPPPRVSDAVSRSRPSRSRQGGPPTACRSTPRPAAASAEPARPRSAATNATSPSLPLPHALADQFAQVRRMEHRAPGPAACIVHDDPPSHSIVTYQVDTHRLTVLGQTGRQPASDGVSQPDGGSTEAREGRSKHEHDAHHD